MKKKFVSLVSDSFLIKLADRFVNVKDSPTQKMKDETVEILNYVIKNRNLSFLEHSIIIDILDICLN